MKSQKKTLLIFSILIIISFIVGFSYAYFTPIIIGNDTASTKSTTLGTLQLTYNGSDYIDFSNAIPGTTKSMTFTVKNTGTLPVDNYEVNFSKLVNTFINNELVYTLSCVSSDAVSCSSKTETPVPITEGLLVAGSSIALNTTHTYTFSLTFKEIGLLQDYNQEAVVKFTLTINEIYLYSTLMTYDPIVAFWPQREAITSITFEKKINIPENAFQSWDVSSEQNNGTKAYIIDDGLGTQTYKLYIQSNGNILANSNSNHLFYLFTKVKTINNIEFFSTIKTTDMSNMFEECRNLKNLNLSSFDTSNVTDMSSMFSVCMNMANLNLSSFITKNVTNMYRMFHYCWVNYPDLSTFDTSSVTTMKEMFKYTNLYRLDLTNFDTSSVTDMSGMFSTNYSLDGLNLSSFNTSNVIDMTLMFEYSGYSDINGLDLSNFNTSKVKKMGAMFYHFGGKIIFNSNNFNTNNVTNMSGMFSECQALTNLDLSFFNTENVTDMSGMFKYSENLTSLDLSSFDTSNVTNMSWMFDGCESLTNLDLSSFNTNNVSGMWFMFSNCISLTSINMKNMIFINELESPWMFKDITSGINIIVKDTAAQTFIIGRLTEEGKTGIVTIWV